MYYAIFCVDKPGALELRLANRPDHLAHLDAHADNLVSAGPTLDGDEKPNGSLIIMDFGSLSEAEAFAENDPYAKAGVFESVTIRPWKKLFPAE